jgi:hypothetical protein
MLSTKNGDLNQQKNESDLVANKRGTEISHGKSTYSV